MGEVEIISAVAATVLPPTTSPERQSTLHCRDRVQIPEHVRKRLREVVQAVVSEDKPTIVVERGCQPQFGVAKRIF
jgi:hypothetical protein